LGIVSNLLDRASIKHRVFANKMRRIFEGGAVNRRASGGAKTRKNSIILLFFDAKIAT
jgi:hypothetical protein